MNTNITSKHKELADKINNAMHNNPNASRTEIMKIAGVYAYQVKELESLQLCKLPKKNNCSQSARLGVKKARSGFASW